MPLVILDWEKRTVTDVIETLEKMQMWAED